MNPKLHLTSLCLEKQMIGWHKVVELQILQWIWLWLMSFLICSRSIHFAQIYYTWPRHKHYGLKIFDWESYRYLHDIVDDLRLWRFTTTNMYHLKKTRPLQAYVATWPLGLMARKCSKISFWMSTGGFDLSKVQNSQPKTYGWQSKWFVYAFSCCKS
jgi:hypothetical protein